MVPPAVALGCEVDDEVVVAVPRENSGAAVEVDAPDCEAGVVVLGPKLKPPVAAVWLAVGGCDVEAAVAEGNENPPADEVAVAAAGVLAVDVAAEVPVPPRLSPPKSGFCAVLPAAGAADPEAGVEVGAKGDVLFAPPLSGIAGLENKFEVVGAVGCAPNKGVEAVG